MFNQRRNFAALPDIFTTSRHCLWLRSSDFGKYAFNISATITARKRRVCEDRSARIPLVPVFWSLNPTEYSQGFRPEFLNRGSRPPWGPRSGAPGATSRGLYQIALRCTAKLLMSRGGHKCWGSLKGGHKPWKVENHWFRASWDRLVFPHWRSVAATVILLSTRGTADSDIWLCAGLISQWCEATIWTH